MTVGLLLPAGRHWAARNAVNLGPRAIQLPRLATAERLWRCCCQHGLYAWTKTWDVSFSRRVSSFTLETCQSQPESTVNKSCLRYAVDSPEEFSRVASLLESLQTRAHGMTSQLDFEFAELERKTHEPPSDSDLSLAFLLSAPPRCGSLQGLRCCPTPAGSGRSPKVIAAIPRTSKSRSDWGVHQCLYVAMGLAAAWLWRANPGVLLTCGVQPPFATAFLTQLQTCEPRYVVVCFPALPSRGLRNFSEAQSKGRPSKSGEK